MRSTKRLTAVAVSGALVLALAGCDAVQQAADTANTVGNAASTASVCAEAVAAAATTPDLTDPQAAVDQVNAAGDELATIASRAADTTVNEAIDKLATTMRETTVDDLTSAPEAWLRTKADQAAALSSACGL